VKKIVIGIACAALAQATWAANLASDNAADSAYSGGWTNGSNGGFGFGPWQLSTSGSSAGFFLGSSTQNWDSADDGANVGGLPNDGDIDTDSLAWGMFAGFGGNTATAIRPFTGGALSIGQTFSFDFDTGDISFAGTMTFSLLDALNNPVFTITSIPFAFYDYTDSGGTSSSGVGFGSEGATLSFTLTGATAYSATLTRRDGASASWAGTVAAAPESFRAQGVDVGDGTPFYFYVNNLSIVPEPSTLALGAAGLLGLALRAIRIRRRLV
jgi:hypothetical protein